MPATFDQLAALIRARFAQWSPKVAVGALNGKEPTEWRRLLADNDYSAPPGGVELGPFFYGTSITSFVVWPSRVPPMTCAGGESDRYRH